MRVSGEDLQHNRQLRTADEAPGAVPGIVHQSFQAGGPMSQTHDQVADSRRASMKEALQMEKARHNDSSGQSQKQLERHYSRPHNSKY